MPEIFETCAFKNGYALEIVGFINFRKLVIGDR